MDDTLWKHEEKKWKPRNKQAALITRRANWLLLHTPPPEPAKVQKQPTLAEHLAEQRKLSLARIAQADAKAKLRRERRAAYRAAHPKPPKPPKLNKCMWAAKAERLRRKRLGLPPATTEELRAIRAAQPEYGTPLYST